ncbi:SDR family NAD(P)-dependent oxidoreductase [Lysinibacter cavernae]|uniref:2-deoxy-D-gluconate 3-dehydrogenase n=1 Tax=Lysinibacter cavernae TaxID=1640652 RepID=A0A7X5R323_9MICO|nr:SDR family oxidoreductase [Lysinibacter cavernae]NIH54765.1 2-deoxy-D-gluconate 3-dehydrogenase [Lysinibacter cavernae]
MPISNDVDAATCFPEHFALTGKHVIVTGAGRGLGQGAALSAAAAGATVSLVARSEDQLNETAEIIRGRGGDCHVIPADLSDTDALEGLVDGLWARQPVHGIVHSAGVQLRKEAVDLTPDDWRFVQRMNVEAPVFLSTAIARRQIEAEAGGSHVFIGSLNSSIALPRIAPYVASKTAIVGVARSFSTEWAPAGIRSNVIGPGYFHTKLTEGLLGQQDQLDRILGRIPMGKLGNPSDIGGMAVFLLSDASAYVSGQLLNVDGGWLGA